VQVAVAVAHPIPLAVRAVPEEQAVRAVPEEQAEAPFVYLQPQHS
jgi:hypothetical protein